MDIRPRKQAVGVCPHCRGLIRPGCCSRSIDRHWKVMPPPVKEFILDSGHLSDDGFISMERSSPQNIHETRRIDICAASWYLALIYLRMGLMREARALTINGAFVHQCITSSIEYVKQVCNNSSYTQETVMDKLNFCTEGFYATQSPETIKSFIQRYLPPDYQQTMATFANLSSMNDVNEYAMHVSDDYLQGRGVSVRHRKTTDDEVAAGTQMKLSLVENDSNRQVFDVLSTTTLKDIFAEYATKRGVSLRSLRFSFAGRPLFLSQVGKTSTPGEFGMRDQDIINVYSSSQSACSMPPTPEKNTSKKKTASGKRRAKSKRSKGHSENESSERKEAVNDERAQEELKIEHSKKLTKIHEELQPRLKQIRQRLNAMLLERRQPKNRNRRRNSKGATLSTQEWADTTCQQCLGGKVGKSHFIVNVGDVQYLYKTRKAPQHSPGSMPALDLHGCTKEEALAMLDRTLKSWIDLAMQGSHPFVIQAKIICGCGSQTLREVVEEWIKSNRNVANAPKRK